MKFLRMIWITNKNFEQKESQDDSDEDADSEEFSLDDDNRKTFMYEDLIKNIMKYAGNEVEDRLNELAQWNLSSTDNLLKALLIHKHDYIAAHHGEFYLNYEDSVFFVEKMLEA